MQRRQIALLVFTLCAPFTGWSAGELKFPTAQPTEPQNTAKTFHVLDGFQMQLIAAEPLVTDPVAITYDEDGRAYVCEMNDYPYTDKEHHKHAQENPTDQSIGKVRLLTDTDGDGVFDKATVFADGLSWPTGAACWKGGIFVTATPDVWYLKDTNGDGVADVRQKVFTGFKKLNVQAVMNNPIWGLDHRIYIAGGSNGGEIQRAPGSESVMPLPADFKPLPIKRNDFSFDPSTGDVRLESGGARFGNTFDDWGNRFLCNIRNPCQHVVLPYRYLARNPYLVVPSALNDCAEAGDQLPVYRTSPPEPWREFRAKRWVQEGSTLPRSELVGAGVVTSSAGITVYRGDAYPPEYRDFVFVADVAGNLFYRMKLVPDGVTFKAVQVDGTKNFCTSDDLWSRPVNFVNAPDGCLHVCDMYREIIEHPWSIPDDIHTAVDLLRGRDQGRLYRLAPKSFKPRPTPKLSTSTTPALVALLDHPNAWHRETAQRLLFERQDLTSTWMLTDLIKSKECSPRGKTHALFLLQGMVNDADARVCASVKEWPGQAQRAVADVVSAWIDESWPTHRQFEHLTKSKDPNARFAWSMFMAGRDIAFESAIAWRDFIVEGCEDPWLRRMILLAGRGALQFQLKTLVALPLTPGRQELMEQIVKVLVQDLNVGDSAEVLAILAYGATNKDKHQLSEGITARTALAIRAKTGKSVREVITSRSAEMKQSAMNWIDRVEEESRAGLISKPGISPDLLWWIAARTIARLDETPWSSFLESNQPVEFQFASLEALGAYHEPAVADILIGAWPKLTPALRDKASSLLLSRTDRIAKLLDAIEAKKILPSQLSAATKATLGRQKTPALADRIAKLIGDGGSSNRKAVITKYKPVMSMTGDPIPGAKIYETLCMVCHRHLDRGNDVGPNLGTIKAWTAEQILTNVLDPNREVSPNFALYIVETNDGRTLSGLITSETAGNLTLKRADGGTDTVLRSEIKSLTSPGISLMPEGLEAAISPQQMADLIAYLKAP